MPINIAFAGARIGRPGAYSTVDTDGMVPITLGAFNVLAFVGKMDASATVPPKTAVYFNDPSLARKALKKGLFLEAVETAWSHSADLICFVRVDDATQAKGTIEDAGGQAVFEVVAKDYGTLGNDITYDVDVNEETGDKTLNFAIGDHIEQYHISNGTTNDEVALMVNRQSAFVRITKKSDNEFEAPNTPTALSGGSGGGETTDDDWQQAIDVLNKESVQGIVPVSDEPAIIAKVDAHIANMSTVKNRKERRGFYGHSIDAKIDDIKDLRMSINNERGQIASPYVYVYGDSGEKEARSSLILASAYAGLWSSKDPQDPITYDFVKVAGLGVRYESHEIEDLLANGIAVTEYVEGKGYRIVQGVTTDTSADVSKNELSVSTLKDVMSINMREYMEDRYVGKAGIKGIEVSMHNDAISMIQKFEKAGWIAGYVEGSLKIRKEGTAYWVDWEGVPTLPINNFLITSHFTI